MDYCSRFDGREIVRQTVEANGEYLVLWVRDGDYAYYESKLLPKAPGLGDVIRSGTPSRRLGNSQLPLIAYCVVQQGGHFLEAHPEWEMRGADGNRLADSASTPVISTTMKEILAEQLAYGIDGFHIDMLDQGFGPPYGCWCDTCQEQFENGYGPSHARGRDLG